MIPARTVATAVFISGRDSYTMHSSAGIRQKRFIEEISAELREPAVCYL